ncbi:carboxypeptidase regulatory-like domain-containing protein [Mucilaginibacter sp. HMF5004]|uniref:TonB-dependent receptor n=1 Tax=Mucilaginibacter rivuli TaxID=2857527 RepID=UPI001C5D4616|nr:TonB-dependent receptor [Mucilaginibacter rivuli]MBW4891789.1 carboxypeptidase regulatory-like domain-containing protein [Mucilaginibacter rivuli]
MKNLYKFILTGIFLAIAGIANAQLTSAVISGKIVDQKGIVLPGVTVSAVNTSTGTRYGAQTNADGRYSIQNVNPGGPYIITATFIGYKKDERTDVTLSLGTAIYNFKLIDATTELKTVNIVGGATKNGAGTNVNQAQIRRMPSINRNLQDITRITPQSANNSFQGTNFRYNNVTLDGAINNDAIGFSPSLGGQTNQSGQVGSSTRTSPVSLDAIQDVQVFVAPYDIKIGNVLGGSINAVTRSGTNKVTGSVFAYGRNAGLVGPNNAPVLSGGDGASEPGEFHDYQAGFRLGFPIVKDKLFFFTNEEIARRQDPVISGAGSAGANPILSITDAQAIAAAFKSYSGYDAGTYDNTTIFSNSNKFFNRLDWNINDKNQLTLRNNTIISTASNLERDGANFRFGSIDYTSHNNSTSFVGELKSKLGSSLSNSLLLGYSNVHDYRDPSSNPALPQIEIAGNSPGTTIFLGTDREAAIFDMRQKTMEFTDNVTLTKGINTFTFGTHNEFYDITYNFVNAWNGRIAYGSTAKDIPTVGDPAQTGIQNFLRNFPTRYRTNYNYTNNTRDYILANPSAKFNVNLLSAYAQDEIQATDNLKITAGIRFDYADVPTKQPLSAKTTGAGVDANYGNTYTYTLPKDITNNYLGNIQINPRVSFNYDVNGDQSIIIRGGTGSFTGRVPFAWFGYAFYNNGVTYGAYDKNNTNAFVPGGQPVAAPSNGGLTFANSQGFNTSASGATQVDMIDNNFKMPQVWRSNLAFDFKTADQWKFTVEGIYTNVIRDLKFQQVNTVDKVTYYPYDVDHVQPIFIKQNTSGNFTNAYLLSNTNKGYRYSVTGQVAKSFPFGLDANVAYTYGESKDVTNGIRNSMESNWQLNQAGNPNDPQAAYSNFDVRHRIVSTVNYRLAWGTNKSMVSNFTFFLSAQSGNPYTFGFYNTTVDGTGQQVNVAYIPKVGETINFFSNTPATPTAAEQAQATAFDNFINADSYLTTRRGQFTERNAARTPWNTDLDFRFTQDFNFGTKHKQIITFTFDIINLTNLLNKDWGHYYFSSNTFNSTASVGLTTVSKLPGASGGPAFVPNGFVGAYPTYKFTDPGVPYQVDLFTSRYQMQFGLRYSF